MAHLSVVETLFKKRRSKNLSIYSTAKDSEDLSFIEEHRVKIKFSVSATTPFGCEVKLVGNLRELGSWSVQDAPLLATSKEKYPNWASPNLSITIPSFPFSFEYKYVIVGPGSANQWESLQFNRTASIIDKCSRNYIYEISDTLNTQSSVELKIANKTDFAEALSKLVNIKTLEEQLSSLSDLLSRSVISYNNLALASIAIRNLKNPIGNDYTSYTQFIDWCSHNLSVQQTKILLSSTSPTYIWMAVPTSDLSEKISAYQTAYHNQYDDENHLVTLADLRMALLNEYQSSDDIAGLLITDIYLEKSEFPLLEHFIESTADEETCKVVMAGMWITQLLYLQCIKPKQTSMLISQFVKLRRKENTEFLRDLLSELYTLVLEVYSELYCKVNHQECEALAGVLMSEYKIIYSGIFSIASLFFIKSLPSLNKLLSRQEFISYNCGSCTSKVFLWREGTSLPADDCILICNYLPEEFELPETVRGIVLSFIENLYYQSLIEARKRDLPVLVGNLVHVFTEDIYTLVVSEEFFSIQKVI